jgi:hypothetical protein
MKKQREIKVSLKMKMKRQLSIKIKICNFYNLSNRPDIKNYYIKDNFGSDSSKRLKEILVTDKQVIEYLD